MKLQLAGMITVAKDKGNYLEPVNYLSQTLKEKYTLRETYRKDDAIREYRETDSLIWDGRVLLVMEAIR